MSMTFHSSFHPSSGFIILECQTVSGNTIQESHCNSHMTATCLRKVVGGGSPMHHTIHTFVLIINMGACLHHWSLRPGGECGLTSIVMLCVYCHSSHKYRALNQNLGSANRYNEAYLYIMMPVCTASNAAGQTRSLINNLCYHQAQPHPLHGNSFDINICFPRPPPCHLDLQLAEM